MTTVRATLRIGSPEALARHVARQLDRLFPFADEDTDTHAMSALIEPATARMQPMLNAVNAFDPLVFNHFHSLQYTAFLYLAAHEEWRHNGHTVLAERLFCLNKALHSIEIFYAVQMPSVFFISHGVGTVIGNVQIGERLVIFQNVTVGRVGEQRPTLGHDVVLFPNVVISGSTTIGDHSVIAAGTVLHDVTVPPHVIARVREGKLMFSPCRQDYSALYLRPSA